MSKTPKEIWCKSGLYYEYKDDWSEGSWSPTNNGGVKYIQADRIEALEAQRKKTYEALLNATRLHDEVEAKLAKAVEAVWSEYQDSIVNKWTFRKEHVANAISRSTLAEITGGKDE